MKGKTCLITGATSGIGRITATALAARGADLILPCRDPAKGVRFAQELQRAHPGCDVKVIGCDLAALGQVQDAANQILATGKPLHVLVNNAGVFNFKRLLTEDGFEEMFAVNHLAHFLLTMRLLPLLAAAPNARIVNVGSGAHRMVKGLNFNDLNFETGFRALKVYSHSKLANGLFNTALAHRVGGANITANLVDPGEVSTNLAAQNGWLSTVLRVVMRRFLSTPEKGAQTSIYAACAPELEGVNNAYLRAQKIGSASPQATDLAASDRLWEVSCAMIETRLGTPVDMPELR